MEGEEQMKTRKYFFLIMTFMVVMSMLLGACFRRLLDVIASLSHGAESRGMRPEAVEVMRSQLAQLRRVYELQLAYSGIYMSDVEELLL